MAKILIVAASLFCIAATTAYAQQCRNVSCTTNGPWTNCYCY